jgi:hypothetical protein
MEYISLAIIPENEERCREGFSPNALANQLVKSNIDVRERPMSRMAFSRV